MDGMELPNMDHGLVRNDNIFYVEPTIQNISEIEGQ